LLPRVLHSGPLPLVHKSDSLKTPRARPLRYSLKTPRARHRPTAHSSISLLTSMILPRRVM